MTTVFGIDPRIGTATPVTRENTPDEVARIASAAAAAAPAFETAGRALRARLLRAISEQLEHRRRALVEVANRETGLGETRLNNELTRTAYQARLFAEVLDEGGYLEATIDHAGPTPMGPGPDLRRMLISIGPVAVFGASNFPFAFSVPGGDKISALAAGSPVVVKAHGSHPGTSLAAFEALTDAAQQVEAPEGVLGIVFGQEAGALLVADPRIKAVGFTGSLVGGKALLDIISQRDEPIPFYGELASLNPVIIAPGAAAARGQQIGAGLAGSVTGSGGQLCTKPGIVFVPEGEAGDVLAASAAAALGAADPAVLLNERIHESYRKITDAARGAAGVTVRAQGKSADTAGFHAAPILLEVSADTLPDEVTQECFGPATVLARYRDIDQLRTALAALPSSLTATVHSEDSDSELVTTLGPLLRERAGRVLYNGFPTGVLVSWAQTHGGPWPATNTAHTSVGTTAIRRFLRPVTWQDAPAYALPTELRDEYNAIPRRIDGVLTHPGT